MIGYVEVEVGNWVVFGFKFYSQNKRIIEQREREFEQGWMEGGESGQYCCIFNCKMQSVILCYTPHEHAYMQFVADIGHRKYILTSCHAWKIGEGLKGGEMKIFH